MTNIIIYQTDMGEITGFDCNGHAGYAGYGMDIVCASVSVLVINTINSIETFCRETVAEVATEEAAGFIRYRLSGDPGDGAKLLLKSLIFGLKEIEKQYGNQYVKLTFLRE